MKSESGGRVTDTSPEADALQIEIYRSMTGAERMALALEMSEWLRELARSRVRADHPDWSDYQVNREVLRYAFLESGVADSELPLPLR